MTDTVSILATLVLAAVCLAACLGFLVHLTTRSYDEPRACLWRCCPDDRTPSERTSVDSLEWDAALPV